MPRRIKGATERRATFLRAWREHRGLTLERAIERFVEMGLDDMSIAQLSRIETGKQPYIQDFLEMAANAYRTDVASLLERDPTDPDGIWSIWDNALPAQRRAIVEHAKIIKKTGS